MANNHLQNSKAGYFDHERWDVYDVCKRLRLIEEDLYTKGRELLLRIVAMLTKMGRADTAYTNI